MENLEKQCLEKLNNILSKFNLEIEATYIESPNVWQYRLVDNFLPKNTCFGWLYIWSSISDMLMHRNSIFECLRSYAYFEYNSYSYKRYLEAYNVIKYLENICCLEEFIIRCDLEGI